MADMFQKRARELAAAQAPLAERMRPAAPEDFVGQDQLVGPQGSLRGVLHPAPDARPVVRNMLLWGPPGTGKTTLARLLAERSGLAFETLSATSSGVKDVRELLDRARLRLGADGKGTLVFIDEIHRFNKAQQDSLLHAAEDGLITLIGATTENPSFEVNAALLSRCRVHVLKPLDDDALRRLAQRAIDDPARGVRLPGLVLADDGAAALRRFAGGDARRLLNALESTADLLAAQPPAGRVITAAAVEQALGARMLRYDRKGDEHYDLASAMIKSVRGSDPHAAIYYAIRMLRGGEPPEFVLRRLAILASEDIGNADPGALNLAASAITVAGFIGLPEAEYTVCQVAAYLALAPKSNAAATARAEAARLIAETGEVPVPLNIRNAPTGLMKELGHGKGYHYAHDYEEGFFPESLLPEALRGARLYQPTERGFEARLKARLEELQRRVDEAQNQSPEPTKPDPQGA
ncbi:MAG: replication-associated recombination protein A [Planctomycetes bacterium]|nr:replication-associated recombination protein A [Planctomycetota bacterium]